MKAPLSTLIEKTRSIRMTDAQRAEQRISFAFGNIHLAGSRTTAMTCGEPPSEYAPVIASPDQLRIGDGPSGEVRNQ